MTRLLNLVQSLLVEVGELVGAQQCLLTLGHIAQTFGQVVLHVSLNLAGQYLCQETAVVLNSQEAFPCLVGNHSRQVLQIIRTGSGVNHFVEMALLGQQQLLVACDTLREIVGLLVCHVKRRHYHRVHTCDGCGHSLCLAAEQVHVGIEDSHVERAGRSANVHLHCARAVLAVHFLAFAALATIADRLVLANNLRPQHTSGAELGNLHEVVALNAHVELDSLGSGSAVHTGFGQQCHVFSAPSQRIGQLLRAVSTCVAQVQRVHADGAVTRKQFLGLDSQHQTLFDSLCIKSMTAGQHLLNRVAVDAAMQRL